LKTFYCDKCGSLVFFENTHCLQCKSGLGFIPDALDLATLRSSSENLWVPLTRGLQGQRYRLCANGSEYQVCNWMIPEKDDDPLCQACRLNLIIPDLSVAGNHDRWQKFEVAKRRLIYTLKHLGLTAEPGGRVDQPPLRFKFLADPPQGPKVMTGHAHGVITLAIAEADDAVREERRLALKEVYRTLLGHVRHEIAHYYWDFLIGNSPRLGCFRKLFGDETSDYGAALSQYYQQGPPADWNLRHVTPYASAHPWEDWAETFAHYLHIRDMVETGAGFGISLQPRHPAAHVMTADLKGLDETKFDHILAAWLPLTYALNEINRGMGLPDVYPFILSEIALKKLRFVHDVVLDSRDKTA
jgi:hypothetical protein